MKLPKKLRRKQKLPRNRVDLDRLIAETARTGDAAKAAQKLPKKKLPMPRQGRSGAPVTTRKPSNG